MPHKKLHIVFGTVNDKDLSTILKLLPKKAIYYFCKANIPRAMHEKKLKNVAHKNQLSGNSFDNVRLALNEAKKAAQAEDLIFVGGSTFVVAEVI